MPNLNTLNPEQRQAVETTKGPVLILAGAGTGKTRVITFRIAHLIERGVKPGNVLAVTFTNKAAREMRERVNELLPRTRNAERGAWNEEKARNAVPDPNSSSPDLRAPSPPFGMEERDGERRRSGSSAEEKPDRPTICTFHSLCVRILRSHIEKLGYKRNFVIYDESEQLGAIRKILSSISAKGEKTDPRAVLSLLSRYKNGGSRAAAFGDPNVAALAEHVRKKYESALHACNALDFDDLILHTLRLFREHPDALEACRNRFRYVMVDEYQDTNAAQFELVHSLTKEHRNLCVVGDDDQSIYGWRGAEVANLLDLEKHFPEVKVVKLEQNYRSTNTILKAANAVIKHNARRRGKQLWSQKGQGSLITVHAFHDDEEEARTVVEDIEFMRLGKRVPWGSQAILFRTNLQSRPFEVALRQANVRYHLIGGQSFFDRREVRDLIAYLKVFINPHDDVNLLRIANVPARGLSDVTMERLLAASQERHCSVFAAMSNAEATAALQGRARESIAEFVRWIEAARAPLFAEGRGVASLKNWADQLLTDCGYYAELRRSEKDAETAESRVRNLKDLLASLDDAAPHAPAPADRLLAFLEDIALDQDKEEDQESAGDAVTLITMHSCKGLEYPHVYVVGLEDGLLPHSRSKVEGTMDEERRLFYVAITRAQETLTLSHCAARKKYGQLTPCHPSPFLNELPEEFLEHASARAKQPVSGETGQAMFAALRAAIQ
jgi:superfamily I DNA/RNA helicase